MYFSLFLFSLFSFLESQVITIEDSPDHPQSDVNMDVDGSDTAPNGETLTFLALDLVLFFSISCFISFIFFFISRLSGYKRRIQI